MHKAIVVQQPAAIFRQRLEVSRKERLDDGRHFLVVEWFDQLLDVGCRAGCRRGLRRHRPGALSSSFATLLSIFASVDLRWRASGRKSSKRFSRDVGVPDFQWRELGILGHLAPVSRGGSSRDFQAGFARQPILRAARTTLVTSRLTSHSHGPGQCLIEVRNVEHQDAFRKSKESKVRDVRITTKLDGQIGHVDSTQVPRHDGA